MANRSKLSTTVETFSFWLFCIGAAAAFLTIIIGIERWRKHHIEHVVGHEISWVDFWVITAK